MEALEVNNVELYGKQIDNINFNDKFDIIKNLHKFKSGTIKGSYYENELYLIDDTNKGIHTSWSGWRICDLEPVYESKEKWDYKSEKYVIVQKLESYRTVTNESLEEYVEQHEEEVKQWFDDHIDMVAYENAVKEKQKKYEDNYNQYYEVEFNTPKYGKMYLDNNMTRQFIYIESNNNGLYVETDDLCFGGAKESIFETVLKYMYLNRNLFADIKQLKNGYMFNDTYYSDLDEVIYDIEVTMRKKKLIDKFMNDGLTLDDFNKGEEKE